jgi:hypothetical protein
LYLSNASSLRQSGERIIFDGLTSTYALGLEVSGVESCVT